MTEKRLACFQSGKIFELTNISHSIFIYLIFRGFTTKVTTVVSDILYVFLKQSHQRMPTSYPEPGGYFGSGWLFVLLQDIHIQHTCNFKSVTYNTGGGGGDVFVPRKIFYFLFVNYFSICI